MPGPCAVCQEPSTFICSGCKLLNYCSKSHQRIHWKQAHKGSCRPNFRLEEDEELGRYLVAAKDIRKGDVVFQEPPLVLGPKPVTVPVCLGCHKLCTPKGSRECEGCGFPLCSPKCQASDFHVDECRLMSERKFRAKVDPEMRKKEVSYAFVVPLRCLFLKDKEPKKYDRIRDLQSHVERRIDTPAYKIYRKNLAEFIRDRLGREDVDETDILTVAGILDTNAFEIRTKTSTLRGLYNAASMLSHSCRPNTKHYFLEPEMTIVVTATTDISSGELITATYTQTLWGTLSRRDHLRAAKCFDCTCERCADPTEFNTFVGAIRCVTCTTPDGSTDGPYVISTEPLNPDAPWKCQNCGRVTTSKQMKSGNESLREELSRQEKTVTFLESFLDKYEAGVLHPRNSHVVQVKHALVRLLGNSEGFLYSELSDSHLEKKVDYCHDLLELADVLEPGFSRFRGEILSELQAAMVMQAKRQFNQGKITKDAAQKSLTDALAILKEVLGILALELDREEFEKRMTSLSKELED